MPDEPVAPFPDAELLHVQRTALPDPLGTWADPDAPLPSDVWLEVKLPEPGTAAGVLEVIFGAVLAVAAVGASVAVAQHPDAVGVVFSIALAGGAIWLLRRVPRVRARARDLHERATADHAAGRWRQGVVLHDRGLLSLAGETASWIPRSAVVEFQQRNETQAASTAAARTWVIFERPGGERLRLQLPFLGADDTRMGRLRSWRLSGVDSIASWRELTATEILEAAGILGRPAAEPAADRATADDDGDRNTDDPRTDEPYADGPCTDGPCADYDVEDVEDEAVSVTDDSVRKRRAHDLPVSALPASVRRAWQGADVLGEERFWPAPAPTTGAAGLIPVGVGLLALAGWWAARAATAPDAGAVLTAAFAAVLGVGAAFMIHANIQAVIADRQARATLHERARAGSWRDGVHLLDDGIAVVAAGVGSWVPRSIIVRVEEGRALHGQPCITLHTDDGAPPWQVPYADVAWLPTLRAWHHRTAPPG